MNQATALLTNDPRSGFGRFGTMHYIIASTPQDFQVQKPWHAIRVSDFTESEVSTESPSYGSMHCEEPLVLKIGSAEHLSVKLLITSCWHRMLRACIGWKVRQMMKERGKNVFDLQSGRRIISSTGVWCPVCLYECLHSCLMSGVSRGNAQWISLQIQTIHLFRLLIIIRILFICLMFLVTLTPEPTPLIRIQVLDSGINLKCTPDANKLLAYSCSHTE